MKLQPHNADTTSALLTALSRHDAASDVVRVLSPPPSRDEAIKKTSFSFLFFCPDCLSTPKIKKGKVCSSGVFTILHLVLISFNALEPLVIRF